MKNLYAICKKNVDPITNKIEEGLMVGNIYKVNQINMGSPYTSIYLEGFKQPFNSIYFNFFEKIDIFNSKKYNPYL